MTHTSVRCVVTAVFTVAALTAAPASAKAEGGSLQPTRHWGTHPIIVEPSSEMGTI